LTSNYLIKLGTLDIRSPYREISSMFEEISENIERIHKYQLMFVKSRLLQESIVKLYDDILQFSVQVAKFFGKSAFSN
jgi:hypothetical protein